MEIKKGTIKREVAKLEVKDFEVTNIIINSLVEKGFEVITVPITNGMNMQIGEQLTIYRFEIR